MKKSIKILTISLLVIMLSTVVSCRKNNSNSTKNDDLQGQIKVLTDRKHEQSLKIAIDNFKKIHKKVDIKLMVEDKSYEKFEQSVAQKDGAIDVITIEDPYVQYYINKLPNAFLDVAQDIDEYKDKIPKGKIDNLSVKNKIYGFPWSTSPKVILYRSDIFTSKGIDANDIKTWNDYIEIGKKLSKDTGKKVIANVENENNDIYLLLANELRSSYFNKDNKDNKINFDSKEWGKVTETVKRLYDENIIYDLACKEAIIDTVQKDKIISFIADPYYVSYLMKKVPNQKGKWSAMKLPAFEPGGNRDVSLGGCNLMINKTSKNEELSKEFIKFAVANEKTSVEIMKNQGEFPIVTNMYNLVDFNSYEDYFNSRVWNLFGTIEKGASEVNYTQYFFIIREDVKNALAQANLKMKDIKLILDSLQKDLDKKIDQR